MSDDAEALRLVQTLRTGERQPEAEEKDSGTIPVSWDDYILGQTARSLLPSRPGENLSDQVCSLAAAGVAGIAPKDRLEEMIAAQMFACHDAALDCFRYAVNSNETSSLRREHLNQAGKLSRTFAMLLDALNRHRGKGQQKIEVKHAHIHSGGQAVVGVVEAPGGGVQPNSESRSYETGNADCRRIMRCDMSDHTYSLINVLPTQSRTLALA